MSQFYTSRDKNRITQSTLEPRFTGDPKPNKQLTDMWQKKASGYIRDRELETDLKIFKHKIKFVS